TGDTASPNFPIANALHPIRRGSNLTPDDAFITKLNPAGSALVYSTFIGGNSNDWGAGIAVDSSGSAYVVGATYSANFPTANALQPFNHGFINAFVVKLDPTGLGPVYSTY